MGVVHHWLPVFNNLVRNARNVVAIVMMKITLATCYLKCMLRHHKVPLQMVDYLTGKDMDMEYNRIDQATVRFARIAFGTKDSLI